MLGEVDAGAAWSGDGGALGSAGLLLTALGWPSILGSACGCCRASCSCVRPILPHHLPAQFPPLPLSRLLPSAAERPKNSALEVDMDFDTTVKPPPQVSGAYVQGGV